jgi:hypothetical protein
MWGQGRSRKAHWVHSQTAKKNIPQLKCRQVRFIFRVQTSMYYICVEVHSLPTREPMSCNTQKLLRLKRAVRTQGPSLKTWYASLISRWYFCEVNKSKVALLIITYVVTLTIAYTSCFMFYGTIGGFCFVHLPDDCSGVVMRSDERQERSMCVCVCVCVCVWAKREETSSHRTEGSLTSLTSSHFHWLPSGVRQF